MRKPVIHRKTHPRHGLSAGDRITSDDTPTLVGRAKAGSTITIYDNCKVIGTTTANAAGKWKFTTKKLEDGAHYFTAKAALGGEVSGFRPAFKTVIDTQAPARPTISLFYSASDTGSSLTMGSPAMPR